MKFAKFINPCSHKPFNFLNFDGVSYYMSDRLGSYYFSGDVILNLTHIPGPRAASNIYNIPQLSKHLDSIPDEIVLSWDDYDSPPVKSSFWKALHKFLKSKKYTSVLFHCEHGHGRTGTAASATCIALEEMDAVMAVSMIRENYCKLAIESDIQSDYLLKLDNELNNRNAIINKSVISGLTNLGRSISFDYDYEELDFSQYTGNNIDE